MTEAVRNRPRAPKHNQKRRNMNNVLAAIGAIGLIAISVVASASWMTIPVYYLWNWLMPEIFGLTSLTFIEALGVSMLAVCLFKGGSSSSSS